MTNRYAHPHEAVYSDKISVVALAFNPRTPGGKHREVSEFEASLVFWVSSKAAKATQRETLS